MQNPKKSEWQVCILSNALNLSIKMCLCYWFMFYIEIFFYTQATQFWQRDACVADAGTHSGSACTAAGFYSSLADRNLFIHDQNNAIGKISCDVHTLMKPMHHQGFQYLTILDILQDLYRTALYDWSLSGWGEVVVGNERRRLQDTFTYPCL